jgi:hypothetical protein
LLTGLSFCSYAQNYSCLQAGVRHYFTNGNGYLRGIRIDSVRTMGDTTVYYPFHTPRGAYDPLMYLAAGALSPGGSWLGEKVLQLGNGTFIFDSYWNDSVIIKTQSSLGDTWVFYKDSSALFYQAHLIAVDTMTVLGALDSVKKIMITAQNALGLVTTDPLDSIVILLSKNYGFVQAFDLFTFPYHKADSVYRTGLDYYLDRSTLPSSMFNGTTTYPPNSNITIFKLVDFIIPNNQELSNWNVGAILEGYHHYSNYPLMIFGNNFLDTVISKVAVGTTIHDSLAGTNVDCSLPYPCSVICNKGSNSFDSNQYEIADTFYTPERYGGTENYVFYFPRDTTYCLTGPAYIKVRNAFTPGLGGEPWVTTNYKLGVDKTYFQYTDVSELVWEWDKLTYYNINGIQCGTPLPNGVHEVLQASQFLIAPNPATTEITIQTTNPTPYTITLQNMLGQTLKTIQTTRQKETLIVANLPSGLYIVSIINAMGSGYYEKLVVSH